MFAFVTLTFFFFKKIQREKVKLQQKQRSCDSNVPQYHLLGAVQKSILKFPEIIDEVNLSVPLVDLSGALETLFKKELVIQLNNQ